MRNVICGNHKLELFVYRWLCAHATFDVTSSDFSTFVKALDVISSKCTCILSKCSFFGWFVGFNAIFNTDSLNLFPRCCMIYIDPLKQGGEPLKDIKIYAIFLLYWFPGVA